MVCFSFNQNLGSDLPWVLGKFRFVSVFRIGVWPLLYTKQAEPILCLTHHWTSNPDPNFCGSNWILLLTFAVCIGKSQSLQMWDWNAECVFCRGQQRSELIIYHCLNVFPVWTKSLNWRTMGILPQFPKMCLWSTIMYGERNNGK